MSDTSQVYKDVSKMFLAKYKDLVVGLFRNNVQQSKDDQRFQTLIRNNSYAREIFQNNKRLCVVYDNPVWHSVVLDKMDLDKLYTNVDAMPLENGEQYSDNLVLELLRFFKQDFFQWVDKPECSSCHSTEFQEFVGGQQPNIEEGKYQCSGVEVFRCKRCNICTRFPRYNDPIKLMETRSGRCGEWCNLFTLILKSFGLQVRYISNKEDHVWCEYYSKFLKKWVHVDSCEQAFDEPHIYSVNWNKKMSYCIGYSKDGVTDVSKRYIVQNELPRNLISEADLRFVCEYLTKQLRKGADNDLLYELFCQDEQEKFEWIPVPMDNSKPTVMSETMGRQSGSIEWKSERGEDGK